MKIAELYRFSFRRLRPYQSKALQAYNTWSKRLNDHPNPVKLKEAVGDGAVLFVQFHDGTTWGNSGVARRPLDSRPQKLACPKALVETY